MKKTQKKESYYTWMLLILFAFLGMWLFFLIEPISISQPYNENATVDTRVNITNSAPIVSSVTLKDSINLNAYGIKIVGCNATVYDFDNDTVTLNATLFFEGVAADAVDNQNNHYSNSSCSEVFRDDTETRFICTFDVNYFANNGTWYCNATALDDDDATGTNQSLGSTIQPLVAITVPGIIDFGDLAQGEVSADIPKDIISAGNRDINISVKGWGDTEDDGLSMKCTFGSIAVDYTRYNLTVDSTYADMYRLSQNLEMIPSLYIPKRVSEIEDSYNTTYWKLQIPTGAGGLCEGKILFSASDRGN
jgi:hypothetical protein